jgi:succinate-acetate transporter protein
MTMANGTTTHPTAAARAYRNGGAARPPLGVFLQPIAPPVTLGLWGFFGSTMVLSTWILHWWGNTGSPVYFFVFNAVFGGLVQFSAGIWSFKARDYVASSLLTMWGTYWMGWGIVQALQATGAIPVTPLSTAQPAFAIWFIPLGIFTTLGSIAALSRQHGNFPLWLLLFTIGIGSLILCVGLWSGNITWTNVAAWFFIVGACAAWYVGAMTMLHSAWRRVILPLGKYNRRANIPGQQLEFPTEYRAGQPGVRQGAI